MYLLLVLLLLLLLDYERCVQTSFITSSGRLPGLEEIESGFDVMSMTSVSKKETRFRIFDLSDMGPYRYKFRVLGRRRIYRIPTFVQLTNIRTRRETLFNDMSKSYKHFYSK